MNPPPLLSAEFASYLRSRQADLVTFGSGEMQTSVGRASVGRTAIGRTAILQTGGACLPEPLALPLQWPGPLSEPLIETFVVDQDGSCTGTGGDDRLIEAWLPLAQAFSSRVMVAMNQFGVELEDPAYLTASLSPLDQVTDTPHFDDDQYHAEAGVGLVAIVGSHAGPRLMNEPVGCQPVRSGMPLSVDEDSFGRFATGDFLATQAEANQIVVLPSFAQLHAGPTAVAPIANEGPEQLRRLMVFRAQTVPTVERGSGPV